jgi:hypothetical protein
MLAPDVHTTEARIQSQVQAALPVTTYCQVALTLVPPFLKYLHDAHIQADVAALQGHVKVWGDGLCARYASQIPQEIVGYNARFQAALPGLQAAVSALTADPGDRSALSSLTSGLEGLSAALTDIVGRAGKTRDDLDTFFGQVESDDTVLQKDLAALTAEIPHGDTIVQALQTSLSATFYQSRALSPCVAILTLNESIVTQAVQLGPGGTEVLPIALAQAALQGLRANNEQAQAALAAILDTWAALQAKVTGVLASLQGATAPDLPPILAQLDLQAAAAAWQELGDFVSSMGSPSPSAAAAAARAGAD